MLEEDAYISRALDLARKGTGRTFPNPLVGAVIVSDGRIAGEGYHARAGGPHAEVEAIISAGEKTAGSTLYLNLEPCCHYGKTPPCTDAILDAGIAKIVCSIYDPDQRVRGKGIETLRKNGITVEMGARAEEALELNLPYIHKAITGNPFIVLKLALSLDGRLTVPGSRYLSSERSRSEVHRLRSVMEAVATGTGTFDEDDPIFDRRMFDESLPAPDRILFDSRLSFPTGHRWTDTPDRLTVFCLAGADKNKRSELSRMGVEVVELPGKNGRIDLGAWIDHISSKPVTSVLVEGGGKIATSMMREGIVDRLILFHAPLLSGDGGVKWYQESGPPGWFRRGDLKLTRVEKIDDDIMAVYDRKELGRYLEFVKGTE
ncbi:MAG: bifunctional diaminohydroxyphosphoribosylaminopyrimidine deaminase/5-amino-6-(5-phosphoribosylamino)uracil reductase RibD [Candidatus Krumholzibacteriota bacterium]|nr:bifunctional diaminohydroxyphosphoribosylaminopyrimidine deaminase/5-amino-6-(5-phosphoribosylamino)uracil reductase RibD [Candidatus Krumholzibacteriota bacterium]